MTTDVGDLESRQAFHEAAAVRNEAERVALLKEIETLEEREHIEPAAVGKQLEKLRAQHRALVDASQEIGRKLDRVAQLRARADAHARHAEIERHRASMVSVLFQRVEIAGELQAAIDKVLEVAGRLAENGQAGSDAFTAIANDRHRDQGDVACVFRQWDDKALYLPAAEGKAAHSDALLLSFVQRLINVIGGDYARQALTLDRYGRPALPQNGWAGSAEADIERLRPWLAQTEEAINA